MPTLETPPADRSVAEAPEGWPEVIWSDVWLAHRGGQWYATCVDFDVVGAGASKTESLQEMSELADDYIDLCVAEGLSYAQSIRRLPLGDRLRLHAMRLVTLPLRLLDREEPAHEGSFLLRPHLNGHGC